MVNPAAKHTDEFRRGTIDCITSTGRPMTECCRKLGLNPKSAGKWGARRRSEISGEPNPKARKRELREVQKRIRKLEMENVLLKKPRSFSPRNRRSHAPPTLAGGEGRIPDFFNGARSKRAARASAHGIALGCPRND